jgi:hypothetical protein
VRMYTSSDQVLAALTPPQTHSKPQHGLSPLSSDLPGLPGENSMR